MKLTIFTPTYNRANMLKRLYSKLCIQTNKNFEWLIIDDGSSDNTKELVYELASKNKITIRYYYKSNAGKHTAMNMGFKKALGDLFVCVDSDDYLVNNAVDKIFSINSKISELNVCGFVGMCQDTNGELIGKAPEEGMISDSMEIRDKYHIQGEPEIYYTEYIRECEFPVFRNEKFITEAVVFDKLTKQNKLYYTNVVLMVKDFQKGGLTDNEPLIRINSLNGTLYYYKQRHEIANSFFGKVKSIVNYYRFCFHKRRGQQSEFGFTSIPIGFSVVIPVSFCYYLSDIYIIERRKNK